MLKMAGQGMETSYRRPSTVNGKIPPLKHWAARGKTNGSGCFSALFVSRYTLYESGRTIFGSGTWGGRMECGLLYYFAGRLSFRCREPGYRAAAMSMRNIEE